MHVLNLSSTQVSVASIDALQRTYSECSNIMLDDAVSLPKREYDLVSFTTILFIHDQIDDQRASTHPSHSQPRLPSVHDRGEQEA